MPRYYFDYVNHPTLCDKVGTVLPHDGAAKQEAMVRAHDARSGHVLQPCAAANEIAVRAESGDILFTVRLK